MHENAYLNRLEKPNLNRTETVVLICCPLSSPIGLTSFPQFYTTILLPPMPASIPFAASSAAPAAIDVLAIARQVLFEEAAALHDVAAAVAATPDFANCVQAILRLKGRVVVTGIGKSAHIAGKIVATLNSTGTPALFMHAADAIHGDLGMIQPEDFVVAISKSGDTPEIKVLVPLLRRKGVPLAALVSNADSYLAQQATFVLHAPVLKEACPNNLPPPPALPPPWPSATP